METPFEILINDSLLKELLPTTTLSPITNKFVLSVVNDFEDDIKESFSSRWFLISKKYFKKYNSYSYEFLTRHLFKENQI